MKVIVICAALLCASAGLATAQRGQPATPAPKPPPTTGPFPLPPIGPKALPTIPDAAKGGDDGRKATTKPPATTPGGRGKTDGKTGAGATPGEQLATTPTGTLVTLDGCIEYEESGKRYVITSSSKDRNAPKVPLEASDDVKANVNHRVAIIGTSRPTREGPGTSAVKVDKLEVLKTSCEK